MSKTTKYTPGDKLWNQTQWGSSIVRSFSCSQNEYTQVMQNHTQVYWDVDQWQQFAVLALTTELMSTKLMHVLKSAERN